MRKIHWVVCGYWAAYLLSILIISLFAGCAEMRPVSLPIELTHVSHASQHFEAHPTDYGYNAVSIGAKWRPMPGMTIVLSEGYVLNHEYRLHGLPMAGGLVGPAEIFTGRIVYEIPLR